MGKQISVKSLNDLLCFKNQLNDVLQKSAENLRNFLSATGAVDAFAAFKYEKTVFDPLTGNPENLLEMLNQYQTYLVTIKAAEYLMTTYPQQSFILRFGNIPGHDIEATDGSILAECFAQVSYRNNAKLTKDLKKLESATHATRYVFFYDQEYTAKNHKMYQKKYPDIHIIKFDNVK